MDNKPVFRQSDINNLEFVRQIVLYRLKNDNEWHQFDYVWGERGANYVEFEHSHVRSRFVVLANEVMWQFLTQGIITVGMNASNPTLPWFRITDYGQKVLEAERCIPHDPTGYLDALRAETGVLSTDTTIAYVEEALRCFNRGCHVASVLLLGVAAESVFNSLCDVMQGALTDHNERKKLDPKSHVKPRHRWVVQKYQNLPKNTKRQLPDSLDMTLQSLYELIRRQRNELGHPQDSPPEMSREKAFLFFQMLSGFVSDAQAFAEYCQENGI